MGKLAVATRAFFQASVDLKSASSTSVVDATSGKRILVLGAWLESTAKSGAGLNASISLGSNSTAFDNLSTNRSVTTDSGKSTELILGTATNNSRWNVVDISSTGLNIKVNTASTFTTDTVTVWIEAVILP